MKMDFAKLLYVTNKHKSLHVAKLAKNQMDPYV